MKTLVIGLDGATPELLFGDERLENTRRLMQLGCYGRLESTIPSGAVPGWMCMSTSQVPGSLGIYGPSNRTDYVYHSSETVTLLGKDTVDLKNLDTENKDRLKDEIYAQSREQWAVLRQSIQNSDWDSLYFVEIGLDRLQRGFWEFHDPQHVRYQVDNPYQDVIRDYYLYLDGEFGKILELLTDDTVVLAVSTHGAQRLDGSLRVNEWLVDEGLLVLNEYPNEITPFCKLNVNWDETRVWSDGGSCARVFINVKGREPRGVVDPADYEKLRDEVRARFQTIVDEKGQRMGNVVYKPNEIYKNLRNVAPDLIVQLGGLFWNASEGVGYPTLYAHADTITLDGCTPAPFGSFILMASNNPLHGEVLGAHLLDIAPTLMQLGGLDIPPFMEGRSLVSGLELGSTDYTASDEDIIRERLAGLGYI